MYGTSQPRSDEFLASLGADGLDRRRTQLLLVDLLFEAKEWAARDANSAALHVVDRHEKRTGRRSARKHYTGHLHLYPACKREQPYASMG